MTTSETLKQRLALPHGVNALLYSDGKILACQRRTSKMWAYPGGKIGEGESPTVAIIREVYEETGLRIRPDEIHFFYEGVCTNKDPADTPYWVYSFEIRTSRLMEPIQMLGEPPFQWMNPSDFIIESAFPEFNAETLRQAGITV